MVFFFGHKAWGILAPWPGMELAPAALEGHVLTTESWRFILERGISLFLFFQKSSIFMREIKQLKSQLLFPEVLPISLFFSKRQRAGSGSRWWLALPGPRRPAQGQPCQFQGATWQAWWNLSSESLAWLRADVGKGRSQRCWHERKMSHGQELDSFLQMTSFVRHWDREEVMWKASRYARSGPFNTQTKRARLFLLPAISSPQHSCSKGTKLHPERFWKRRLSGRKLTLSIA